MPRNNPYSNVPTAPPELDIGELAKGRDVELDIGFGRGHFILDRAEARPEALLIGLEMRRKWVGVAGQRAQRRGLDNVIVFYGDIRTVLPHWGPDASLSTVFINFPDPWWKKKHLKRQVITAPLVREVARLLKRGGFLLVQTDVHERAQRYHDVLTSEPRLALEQGGAGAPSDHNPIGVMSHRERKCAESALPVYRFFLRKISE